jgi:membrane protein YdbS with pleckstrin-like domain
VIRRLTDVCSLTGFRDASLSPSPALPPEPRLLNLLAFPCLARRLTSHGARIWHHDCVAISKNLLNEGEEIVFDTRTHPKALILPFLVLLVMLAVAIFLDKAISNSTVSLVVWILALAVVLWLSVWPFLNWLVASYTVTNRRLITRYGVITRRGHDIPLTRVSDVAYEKDIIDRLLGCGTLVISDASTHGQVPLHDIPHVEERQRVLNDLLHRLHDGIPGNEGI